MTHTGTRAGAWKLQERSRDKSFFTHDYLVNYVTVIYYWHRKLCRWKTPVSSTFLDRWAISNAHGLRCRFNDDRKKEKRLRGILRGLTHSVVHTHIPTYLLPTHTHLARTLNLDLEQVLHLLIANRKDPLSVHPDSPTHARRCPCSRWRIVCQNINHAFSVP